MVVVLVKAFTCLRGGASIEKRFFNKPGYIHYCIPDPTHEDDDHEDWQGQVHRIGQYIRQSETNIRNILTSI